MAELTRASLYGLGDILDAHYAARLRSTEVGYGARAGVEIVEYLAAGQRGRLARYLVELVCLRRVGLVERLGSHLELQALHSLDDMVLAGEEDRLAVAERVVPLVVYHIYQ